jgi:hypothetical protein
MQQIFNSVLLKSITFILLSVVITACAVASQPTESSDQERDHGTEDNEQELILPQPDQLGRSYSETPPAATPTQPPASALPDLGPAPDITNQVWLNTDEPLTLAGLRGKVVLVEFWTFG